MTTQPLPVANTILAKARNMIGQYTYSQMDCSHFVHAVYNAAGLIYPYKSTAEFQTLTNGSNAKFELVQNNQKQAGDIILMTGHMGIYDPQGCTVLATNAECSRLNNNAPFLSSRSSSNRGPDYGQTNWWSQSFKVYRWKQVGGLQANGLPSVKTPPFF